MYELALFAGAGGGILGGLLYGCRTICAVEIEPYAAGVLLQRQNDGCLPPFPVWDDVRSFRISNPECAVMFEALRRVRSDLVISGGFPCQDISCAGRGAGLDGDRSGLWREFARIIREIQPRFAFVENSPLLTSRGIDRVLGDMAEMGYDAKWGVLGAVHAGAPHKRHRIWIVADASRTQCKPGTEERGICPTSYGNGLLSNHADGSGSPHVFMAHALPSWERRQSRKEKIEKTSGCKILADSQGERCGEAREFFYEQSEERPTGGGQVVADTEIHGRNARRTGDTEEIERGREFDRGRFDGNVSDAYRSGREMQRIEIAAGEEYPSAQCGGWWATEPDVGRVAHGVAARVDRLKAIGNGQVPAVARLAWETLINGQWTTNNGQRKKN